MEPVSVRLDTARDVFVASDGLELPMRSWLPKGVAAGAPPKAVILALHGFNDYSNAFSSVGPWLAGEGYAVYAYDQRGFGAGKRAGQWAGTEAMARDVRDAVRLLKNRYPGVPVYLMGESMGGAVTMATLAEGEVPDVDGAILAAPAVWGRSTMPFYQRLVLEAMVRLAPGMHLSGKVLDIWPSDNIEMLRALGQDPLIIKKTRVDAVYGLSDLMDTAYRVAGDLPVPVLWLYGKRDEIVPPGPTLAAAARLDPRKGQRLVLYPNGWHMLLRDLQSETVLQDIAAWLEDRSARLPSGAEVDPRALPVS